MPMGNESGDRLRALKGRRRTSECNKRVGSWEALEFLVYREFDAGDMYKFHFTREGTTLVPI
ncbi:hypothetical protein N7493_007056 [Penicillium malachiteum]|uniref:Uncharacterized protein n=1 Tax=Penicillium malachiteum TaxID=1324776 RepID=A0AAD6HKP1_9EURO|nr:hypothetical protein N7493_007056 [Penicillium malachiteum]